VHLTLFIPDNEAFSVHPRPLGVEKPQQCQMLLKSRRIVRSAPWQTLRKYYDKLSSFY